MAQKFQEVQILDFKKPKKTKKDKQKTQTKPAPKIEEPQKQAEPINHDKRYAQLLKRAIDLLNKNNPELAEKSKIVLKPPQSTRIGSKKTAIINFVDICKQLDRHPEHVMNFFITELGREGSIGNQGFVIKIIIQPKQIENLFIKYTKEYVQCQICKRQNTELVKDDKMRLWTLQCRDCKCTRTVPTIKGSEKKFEDYEKEMNQNEEEEEEEEKKKD